MISPCPKAASISEIIPITITVILTPVTLSFLRMSFTKIEDALIIQVSVDDKIAESRPKTSRIAAHFGMIEIAYISAPISPI